MQMQPLCTTTTVGDFKPRAHVNTLAAAMRELGFAVTTVPREIGLLYHFGGGPLGTVTLKPYSAPEPGSPRPEVWRWAVDCVSLSTSRAALCALGITPQRGRRHQRRWIPSGVTQRLELSCLPSEVAALGDWLATWLHARVLGAMHQPTPVPMSRPGEVRSYAWSAAAWIAADAWSTFESERRRTRLLSVVRDAAIRRAVAVAVRGESTVDA